MLIKSISFFRFLQYILIKFEIIGKAYIMFSYIRSLEGFVLSEDKKLRDLFLRAQRDLDIREDLLRDPVAVGIKFGVKFSKEQLAQIEKTRQAIDSIRDIVVSPPTPKYSLYPVGPILRRWEIEELQLIPIPRPGYPAPPYMRRLVYW